MYEMIPTRPFLDPVNKAHLWHLSTQWSSCSRCNLARSEALSRVLQAAGESGVLSAHQPDARGMSLCFS